MYSVFLVEDEIVIRDGLKVSFPWEQYGFAYVGDAADGEMALPLIRQSKPDVIITDIRMPFMDGISLSKIIKKELPNTRIIIISGFDDFSYAQEAISIGVDNYILKPVTKDKLKEVMDDAKKKLDEENEKDRYLEQFKAESQEYEQFARVRFFNKLVSGTMSVSDIYEESEDLGLFLDAPNYNLVLMDFSPMNNGSVTAPVYSKYMARLSEQLMQYLKCCPEYIVFHTSMDTYAIIVKGDTTTIQDLTTNLIENVERRCMVYEDDINWYLAQSGCISRFSEFQKANAIARKRLSCRYMNPSGHIFTDSDVEAIANNIDQDESIAIDKRLVMLFLENAEESEIDGFLDNIINNQTRQALKSKLFCRYFAMTMYMCVCDYYKKLGIDEDDEFSNTRSLVENVDGGEVVNVVKDMFAAAIAKRQNEVGKRSKSQLSEAIQYVDKHYTDAGLSLNEVAEKVNISPSYLSAMFSKENKTTFVEYVTAKRMNQAKKMLTTTNEKTQFIAEQVGYKDPHYFSYIFKKTYGLSPKEYRVKGLDA